MEQLFSRSFADVRIHIAPQAAAIGAHAFTSGTNIYFAPGKANFDTAEGQRLLAHELEHVVQQRAGRVINPYAPHIALVQDRTLDAEARRMAARVTNQPPAAVQRKTARTIQLLEMKKTLAALKPEERELLIQWLDARSPGKGLKSGETDENARALLIDEIRDVSELREMLKLFQRHLIGAGKHDDAYEDAVAHDLYEVLCRSKILAPYSTMIGDKHDIRRSLRFHDDATFARKHYKAGLAINPDIGLEKQWMFGIVKGAQATLTQGFAHKGKIHLRAGDAPMHVAIHELIHKLAPPEQMLGPVLDEGFTEKIALMVCDEQGIKRDANYYPHERVVVDQFIKVHTLNEAAWMNCYFKQPGQLLDKLRQAVGAENLKALVSYKDPVTWWTGGLLTLREKALNKVDMDKKGAGVDLETRVRDALILYSQEKSKYFQSKESQDAITVLNTVLKEHDHACLYAAVRWYLHALNQSPLSVTVGNRLKESSTLFKLLKAACGQWL